MTIRHRHPKKPGKRTAWNSTLQAPSKPMARDKPLPRTAGLPKVNKARKARRKAEGVVYGPHHEWIKGQLLCECGGHPKHRCGFFDDRPNVEGHHLKRVGSGGKDRDNEIPACPVLHDEFHDMTLREMNRKYNRDFKGRAIEYTAYYDMEHE